MAIKFYCNVCKKEIWKQMSNEVKKRSNLYEVEKDVCVRIV